jgi:hypothetical protein
MARTSTVAGRLQRDLAEWASKHRVTIEVDPANDTRLIAKSQPQEAAA